MDTNEHIMKLIIIGNSNVGKSTLLSRFCDKDYDSSYNPTIGIDFRIITVQIDDSIVKVQIWDTGGQERFQAIISGYYRYANCLLLVYDISNRKSFDYINNWIDELKYHYNNDIPPVILVGNKSDLLDKRKVSYEEGKDQANLLECDFLETSAKNNISVNDAFISVIKEAIQKRKLIPTSMDTIRLKKSTKPKSSCSC